MKCSHISRSLELVNHLGLEQVPPKPQSLCRSTPRYGRERLLHQSYHLTDQSFDDVGSGEILVHRSSSAPPSAICSIFLLYFRLSTLEHNIQSLNKNQQSCLHRKSPTLLTSSPSPTSSMANHAVVKPSTPVSTPPPKRNCGTSQLLRSRTWRTPCPPLEKHFRHGRRHRSNRGRSCLLSSQTLMRAMRRSSLN